MQWSPKQKNRHSLTILMVLCALAAAVGYIAGSLTERFVWLFQLICIGGIVAMLFLLIRYHMTWFVYSIRTKSDTAMPGYGTAMAEEVHMHITHLPKDMLDFAVVRGQGQRAGAMECLLGLEVLLEAVAVKPKSDDGSPTPKYGKERYPDLVLYDYTITLFWQEALLLIFLDGERHVGILIEPGEDMKRYLTDAAAGFSGRAVM